MWVLCGVKHNLKVGQVRKNVTGRHDREEDCVADAVSFASVT